MSNRVELSGALTGNVELRVTPAGGRVARLRVDCGEPRAPLVVSVVVTGEELVARAARLRKGQRIITGGSLRALPAARRSANEGLAIELIASTLDGDSPVKPGGSRIQGK